jgi:serine/threonine protein kinase
MVNVSIPRLLPAEVLTPFMASTDDLNQLMLAWFPNTQLSNRKPLTEIDIRGIADVLHRIRNESWSRIPRIYSVLRIINQLPLIDIFVTQGISDIWFPFSQKSLPEAFQSPSARLDFLEAQQVVLTKSLDLEHENGKHRHFSNAAEVPLVKTAELGKGGYGYVDRVISTISHREYARKLIPRGRTFKKDKEVLRAFERELLNLKRLSRSHIHIVEFVGSYTDPRYVGIIMSPVADCDLKEFLARAPLPDEQQSFLRTFFGCLTSALYFLHTNRIRHKDIKPQNVLVKAHQVFLTDFGVSLDWTELGHSTTCGPTLTTPRYCAPEVANHSPRNSLSDVWSLGCVFLEIWTVLRGQTVSAMVGHLEQRGSMSSCYHLNPTAVASWIETIRNIPGAITDNEPSAWIIAMMQKEQGQRWNVHTVGEQILEISNNPSAPFMFTGLCCIEDEDTAESVHSSTVQPDYDVTINPKTQPETENRQSCQPSPYLEDEIDLLARELGQSDRSQLLEIPPNSTQEPSDHQCCFQ